jgi:hypothetical protein
VQRVFKGGSKKLWRGEALNEFVADPLRHRQTDRQRCEGLGRVEFEKKEGFGDAAFLISRTGELA